MAFRPPFNSEVPTIWRRSILYAGELTVVGELVDSAIVPVSRWQDLYITGLIDNAPEPEPELVLTQVEKKARKKKRPYKKRTSKDSVLAPLSKIDTRKV